MSTKSLVKTKFSSAGPCGLPAREIRVAADTEFSGPHTLLIQFATSHPTDKTTMVQIYRSPAVSPPPKNLNLKSFLPPKLWGNGEVDLRPAKEIDSALSPVRVLSDLFGLSLRSAPRALGQKHSERIDKSRQVTITLVVHHAPADLLRLFGRKFYDSLDLGSDGGLALAGNKQTKVCDRGPRGRFHLPVVEYIRDAKKLIPVRLRVVDTSLAFSKTSLEDLGQAFVGVGKSKGLTSEEKANMLQTIKTKPRTTYLYAIRDAILTLRVDQRTTGVHPDFLGGQNAID